MSLQDPGLRIVQPNEGRQYNVMGTAMTYIATADDTRGAYSLAIETTPPHSGLPLHVHHREDEAMYILEGEYEIQCGDQVIWATPGVFVFLPRDTPNRYQNIGDTPARFLFITSPGGFETLIAETSALIASGQPDIGQVHAIADRHGVEFV
jgi:mannose-6-phosphate isomerase-like protein (cupin superfamily)